MLKGTNKKVVKMLKRLILPILFSAIIFCNSAYSLPREPQPQLKPLKIEERNYKYGNIEKALKNPAALNTDSYADGENSDSRRTSTILDVINTIMLVIIALAAVLFISIKIKGVPLAQLFGNKKQNNKFNIISAKQLNDGKTLYLIELNGRQIIVGTTVSKVDSIMPLDKSYSTDEIPPEYIEKLFNDTDGEFKNLEE